MSNHSNNIHGPFAEIRGSKARRGRFHQPGTSPLTDRAHDLFSMPTVGAQRLGVEHLAAAHAAGDRLATLVLGMCAIEDAGVKPDAHAGLRLLDKAA